MVNAGRLGWLIFEMDAPVGLCSPNGPSGFTATAIITGGAFLGDFNRNAQLLCGRQVGQQVLPRPISGPSGHLGLTRRTRRPGEGGLARDAMRGDLCGRTNWPHIAAGENCHWAGLLCAAVVGVAQVQPSEGRIDQISKPGAAVSKPIIPQGISLRNTVLVGDQSLWHVTSAPCFSTRVKLALAS